MKKLFLSTLVVFVFNCYHSCSASNSSIDNLIKKLEDNPSLCIPLGGENVRKIIFINGSKPATFATNKKSPVIFSDSVKLKTGNDVNNTVAKLDDNNQTDAEAKLHLAVAYFKGVGVEQDKEKAVVLLKEAIDFGSAEAAYEYAMMLVDQGGMDQAFSFMSKAANAGFMMAQFHLGVMFWNGDGVKANDALCYKWMKAAADQGFAEAQSRVAISLLKLWDGAKNKEPYRSHAVSYLFKAALQGHVRAIHNLASDFMMREKHDIAKKLFKQSAIRGHDGSSNILLQKYKINISK